MKNVVFSLILKGLQLFGILLPVYSAVLKKW
jgi:hypothetical protein